MLLPSFVFSLTQGEVLRSFFVIVGWLACACACAGETITQQIEKHIKQQFTGSPGEFMKQPRKARHTCEEGRKQKYTRSKSNTGGERRSCCCCQASLCLSCDFLVSPGLLLLLGSFCFSVCFGQNMAAICLNETLCPDPGLH